MIDTNDSGLWCAVNLHPVLRGSIVEDCESATVECAAGHRRGAAEIVVDSGSIVEIQPEYLFRAYWSITIRGLKLGVVAVLGQDIFCPVRGRDDWTYLGPGRLWYQARTATATRQITKIAAYLYLKTSSDSQNPRSDSDSQGPVYNRFVLRAQSETF